MILLGEHWERVKGGLGHGLMLRGEAGIGKSRLVQVLKEQVADEPHVWLACRCSPYYRNHALYPVIELWERLLALRREDTPDEKVDKLEWPNWARRLGGPLPMTCYVRSRPLPRRPSKPDSSSYLTRLTSRTRSSCWKS